MTTATERAAQVVLRDKVLADGHDDHRWRSDEELAELDASTRLRQPLADFLRDYEIELSHPNLWTRRYAIDTLDGAHIGNCMLYDIDPINGQCEIGIILGDRAYWGKGYGRAALRLLIAKCFVEMPSMKRLYLHTLEWNVRARRAFSACGFRETGPVSRRGRNFIKMEVARADWEAGG